MAVRALALGLALLVLGGCSVAGSVSFGDFFLGYGGFSGHHVGIAIR